MLIDSFQFPGAVTPTLSSDTLYETMDHIKREMAVGSRYLSQFILSIYFYTQSALGQRHLGLDTSPHYLYLLYNSINSDQQTPPLQPG